MIDLSEPAVQLSAVQLFKLCPQSLVCGGVGQGGVKEDVVKVKTRAAAKNGQCALLCRLVDGVVGKGREVCKGAALGGVEDV